jgi:hypothetical protein
VLSRRILLFALFLNTYLCEAQQHSLADYVVATSVRVEREHQCLEIFAGLKIPAEQGPTSQKDDISTAPPGREAHLTLILAPGCDSLSWGFWPEFSKNLRFEFGLSAEPRGHDAEPVKAELIGDDSPPWREWASTRTLKYALSNLPPIIGGKFLMVTMFSGELKVTQLSLKIDTTRSLTKGKNRHHTNQRTPNSQPPSPDLAGASVRGGVCPHG